tara:strand:- start:281 stop:853 length:573 start_codon:yes stop_codon:yes gene_type:complete
MSSQARTMADFVSGTTTITGTPTFTGTVTGAGYTFTTPQTLNGQSSRTFTGIPSGVTCIKFGVWRESCSTVGVLKIQIGDSGGIETTGYEGIDVFAGTGGAVVYGGTGQTDGWGASSWTSADNILMHQGEMFRVHGNKWTCDSMAQQHSAGYFIRWTGYKELSAELTQVKFTSSAGTFDDANSYVQIAYQ